MLYNGTTPEILAEARSCAAEGRWVGVRLTLGLHVAQLRREAPEEIVDLIEESDRHLAAMGVGGCIDGPLIVMPGTPDAVVLHRRQSSDLPAARI